MNKQLWKSLTITQKLLYLGGIIFSYVGTLGIALWSFLIEKLFREPSLMDKISGTGIMVIAVILILAIIFYNRHTTKKIEIYEQYQKDIIKEMLIETDEEKKKILREKLVEYENYNLKIKTRKKVFKNAIICSIFCLITLLFYIVEKTSISMRGTFFGISTMLLIGFGFNTAYEEFSKKINLKK